MEQAADDQRIEAETSHPPRPAPPEPVKAKLERLKAGMQPISTDPKAYGDLSKSELDSEVRRIEDLIYQAIKEELEYRFSIGLGIETLSVDPDFKLGGEDYDPSAVYWVRFTPGGPTQKVTLPKDEFPEVYELKALSASLRELSDRPLSEH